MNKLNKPLGLRPLWRSSNLLIEFDDADTLLNVGEKVTLMNWGNVAILSKDLQADGSYVLTGEYLPEDKDFKTTKKITWLADGTNLLIANLIEFDHLIKTPKVE
jgi:glutamyl-tRNA synthetase